MEHSRGIFSEHDERGLSLSSFKDIEETLKNKFEGLFSQHKLELENLKQEINTKLHGDAKSRHDAKYHAMKKEVESLRAINKSLENKLKNHHCECKEHKNSKEQPTQVDSERCQENKVPISQIQLNAFVEKMLTDENVNIAYLPDFVERQLYRNVFTILLGVIQNLFSTTSINLLNHKIAFTISPQNEKHQENVS